MEPEGRVKEAEKEAGGLEPGLCVLECALKEMGRTGGMYHGSDSSPRE